jgi:hypothetical protein
MAWTRHLASLLTLVAFVLLAAAYVPGNGIKAKLHHPMVLGVKVWALAHLLANHTLADLLLFGGFLVWAVLSFRAARARDRAAGTVYPPGTPARTAIAVVVGLVAWAVFAFWAHGAWIGVRPFGRACGRRAVRRAAIAAACHGRPRCGRTRRGTAPSMAPWPRASHRACGPASCVRVHPRRSWRPGCRNPGRWH